MIDSFSHRGFWHLPESPTIRVSGTLTFSSDYGLQLSLDDLLTPLRADQLPVCPEIILGVTLQGILITLFRTESPALRISGNSQTITTCTYLARYAFIGCHLQSREELVFERMMTSTSHLDEWAVASGFTFDLDSLPSELVIRYKQLTPYLLYENEQLSIVMAFSSSFPQFTAVVKDVQISQKAFFQVRFKELTYFENGIRLLSDLRRLVSLAVGKAETALEIHGTTPANMFVDSSGTLRKAPIQIYYQQQFYGKDSYIHPGKMLFTLADISSRCSAVFDSWLKKSKELDMVFDFYFAPIFSERTYEEHRLITLMQAIEAYFRLRFDNFELEPSAHQDRLTTILDHCPDEHKEWLGDALRWSNEKNQRARFKELGMLLGESKTQVTSKWRKLVGVAIETRNFYTHYEPSKASKRPSAERLHRICNSLHRMLDLIILYELGFDLSGVDVSKRHGPVL